ncbi:MAG: peroxiredoxin family protein [Nannocystaceae bacterium]|nr:redoxin domain-containing protein [bacterium]
MRLEAGTNAPDFEAITLTGHRIQLDQLRGRLVWLSFYRYAACPLCCYRVHELLSVWEETFASLDIVSLTVWQSPEAKLNEVLERYQPPFELISDPGLQIYEAYGIEKGITKVFGKEVFQGVAGAFKAGIPVARPWDGPATRRPADFLIAPDGTIDVAFYGENVGQMIPFDDVLSWAQPHLRGAV